MKMGMRSQETERFVSCTNEGLALNASHAMQKQCLKDDASYRAMASRSLHSSQDAFASDGYNREAAVKHEYGVIPTEPKNAC